MEGLLYRVLIQEASKQTVASGSERRWQPANHCSHLLLLPQRAKHPVQRSVPALPLALIQPAVLATRQKGLISLPAPMGAAPPRK